MSDEEAILQLKASDYLFHMYKKSPQLTEEEFAKLPERKQTGYPKSVVIQENNNFTILFKNNGNWEKSLVEMKNDKIHVLENQGSVLVEEQSVDEAVKSLIEKQDLYHVFYDIDLKSLSIVYKRKNKTLGLIVGSNKKKK